MTLEEYSRAKKRAQKLKERLDRSDPSEAKEDLRVARKLLTRILKKIEESEKDNHINPNTENSSDSTTAKFTYRNEANFRDDNRSDEQLMDDLGIIYAIFGRIYKKTFNYHDYIIHFLKQCEKGNSFCSVLVDIYEDSTLIAKNIVLSFWPCHFGDTICGDMGFSSYSENSFKKYIINGSSVLYHYLVDNLKDIWNYYFGLVPLRIEKTADHEMQKVLTADERDKVIARVDRQLSEGISKLWVPRYLIKEKWFYTRVYYNTLDSFLKESGIIYLVKEDGVYIFYDAEKGYLKLIDIKKAYCGYILYLSTI